MDETIHEREKMNELTTTEPESKAIAKIASSRAMAEVQASMIVARNFPRDETAALDKITAACQRKGLAEVSEWEFKRGKDLIAGPTIRLLEVIAQSWGNIVFGWTELERRKGSSTVQAYSIDLETNTRSEKAFDVPHVRETKSGTWPLTSDRDIYEAVANNASRRVRSCLETIIPRDVIEHARATCQKTLASGSTEPLETRVQKMLEKYDEIGVTVELIESKLGHPVRAITLNELGRLGKIFNSIRDGISTAEEQFPAPTPARARPTTLDEIVKPKTSEEFKSWVAELKDLSTVDDVMAFGVLPAFTDYEKVQAEYERENCVKQLVVKN